MMKRKQTCPTGRQAADKHWPKVKQNEILFCIGNDCCDSHALDFYLCSECFAKVPAAFLARVHLLNAPFGRPFVMFQPTRSSFIFAPFCVIFALPRKVAAEKLAPKNRKLSGGTDTHVA